MKKMTQPTISKRARNKFNMPSIRRRCKKLVRSRHKKTIKLSDVDKVWNDYVQIGIIDHLIRYGSVNVDDKMQFEIVGKSIINRPNLSAMLERGITYKKGGMVAGLETFKLTRNGVIYDVVLKDKNHKGGKIIFTPCKTFSKQIHEAILNPVNHYRITK